jgi:hypothetical protein
MLQNLTLADANNNNFAVAQKTNETTIVSFKEKVIKIRAFCYNANPLNWFNDFMNIDVDLKEFECKKS